MSFSKIRNRKTKQDKSGNILFLAYLIHAIKVEFKVRVKNSQGIRENINCLVSCETHSSHKSICACLSLLSLTNAKLPRLQGRIETSINFWTELVICRYA